MTRRVHVSISCLLATALLAWTAAAAAGERGILVSAAASLKDAFTEFGAFYTAKTGVAVQFNFGASGVLQKQIEAGAPVDVFISAGEKQMDELAAKGLLAASTRRNVARNELVLVLPSRARVAIGTFQALDRREVDRIAIGNPKTVPAGQYARQILEKMGLWNALARKLIFAEDVRQVLDYVSRGEVDAGIVYATDARIARQKVVVAAVAPRLYDPVLYPAAVMKDSGHQADARRFIEWLVAEEGRQILAKYGFLSPG